MEPPVKLSDLIDEGCALFPRQAFQTAGKGAQACAMKTASMAARARGLLYPPLTVREVCGIADLPPVLGAYRFECGAVFPYERPPDAPVGAFELFVKGTDRRWRFVPAEKRGSRRDDGTYKPPESRVLVMEDLGDVVVYLNDFERRSREAIAALLRKEGH